MGKITILDTTTLNPVTLIGKMAGVCWGANTKDDIKNYQRGLECLKANHGRTFEFVVVDMVLEGYSARVIREWYTHIGGAPTRLQASTRYVDYKDFPYVTPPSIENNMLAEPVYRRTMKDIREGLQALEELGVPKEDCAMILPLGMTTKIVDHRNVRSLMDMSHQRKCIRAYWEYRELFADLENALSSYSKEWKYIVDNHFKPKCEVLGYCPETYPCGKMG